MPLTLNNYGATSILALNRYTITATTVTAQHKQFQQFTELKYYIIRNFIEPLMDRRYNDVAMNYHNFEYMTEQIEKYKNVEGFEDDYVIFSKIIEILKTTSAVGIGYTELQKKFSAGSQMGMLFRTSRIVLKPEYEVYNVIYGPPVKDEHTGRRKYDSDRIERIRTILRQDRGAMIWEIRARLGLG
jgi:hypothetical protein